MEKLINRKIRKMKITYIDAILSTLELEQVLKEIEKEYNVEIRKVIDDYYIIELRDGTKIGVERSERGIIIYSWM